MMDELNRMADRLEEHPTGSDGEPFKEVAAEAAEMLRAVQQEMWRTNVLLQSYRVVIADIGKA